MLSHLLVLLCFSWAVAARAPVHAVGCVSALECNSQLCADCACVNGQCVCGAGWSGDQCQTPFCVNRSQCNNHGNCVAVEHNISCVCDAGFAGARCEQAVCQLECGHGGIPNDKCTECEGCLGAWRGAADLGVPFSAFSKNDSASGISLIAVNAFACLYFHLYNTNTTAPANCTLIGVAFWTPMKPIAPAVSVYEFVSVSEIGNRLFSTNATAPPGYRAVGSPFFAMPAAASAPAQAVYLSQLSIGGSDTRLSLNATENKACTKWDPSVDQATLLAQLQGMADDSKDSLNKLQALNPIKGNIGWGVDIVTGALSVLPIVELTYTDPTRTWRGFLEPVEAEVVPIQNPQDVCSTDVFPLVSDYVGKVEALVASGQGLNGVYTSPFVSVLQSYFNRPDDRAMSVTQSQYSLYKMILPYDPVTHAPKYVLDRFASQAIAALPPDYGSDTNKAIYRKFLSMWGSSYTNSGMIGGIVEQHALWKTWLQSKSGMTSSALADQAGRDFTTTTGLCGHAGPMDPNYQANRQIDPLVCLGGNPVLCGNVTAWKASVATDPVALSYSVAPISELVVDLAVRANLEAAVDAYLAEANAAWSSVNKCPTSCNGQGSCGGSSQVCSCTHSTLFGYTGRMCSVCDNGYGGNICMAATAHVHFELSYGQKFQTDMQIGFNGQVKAVTPYPWFECARDENGLLFVVENCNSPSPCVCTGPRVSGGCSTCHDGMGGGGMSSECCFM